ncbi:Ada metal-binding domain-containing protein [Nonomuraea sp. NPDC046802]|uniref:Ada metal-binding domain-containing protein n=1 Tax=Nonomuraea sp. NPDC046802 TaxID=3154919 RepID=UPI0033E9D6C0
MTYTLVGADGRSYASPMPGTLGGHRGARLYGRLDCPSALRAIARGGYIRHRVFFADAGDAVAAGYRPCAVCLPEAYQAWRLNTGKGGSNDHVRPRIERGKAVEAGKAIDPASEGAVMAPKIEPRKATDPVSEAAVTVPEVDAGKAIDSVFEGAVTASELETVIELLGSRAGSVVIGHGRDAAPVAEAFAGAWHGTVLAVVPWPERAASWLRQARRFTAETPDAWVVAGAPLGWARMGERLRLSTDWDPRRTVGFASTMGAVSLAAPGTLEGMRGSDRSGNVWQVGRNIIYREIS